MPVIKVEYEKTSFTDEEMKKLCVALQKFVTEVTVYPLEENSVFAAPNYISVNASPAEIYVSGTFADLTPDDLKAIGDKLAEKVKTFKAENDITQPVNISIIKMNWKCVIGV